MFKSNKHTIIIGITEARAKLPTLLKNLKAKKIILMKRGYPLAVIQDYKDFIEKEELLGHFF